MELKRYSKIEKGLKREFLLLQGTGCRWGKCTFCDYHKDTSSDPFLINKPVIDMVDGEFGVLDVINSGSCTELDGKTIGYLSSKIEEKGIKTLWLESHYMYSSYLDAFGKNFPCAVKFRTGIESFNPELRRKWNKGIPESVDVLDVRKYFSGVCLLVGAEGESKEDILSDISIAEKYFEYYSVNLFNENSTNIRRDEELARFVKTEVRKMLEKSDKAELLIDNTDLGVG